MNEEQRNQIHIVLDLETMGVNQDAAIVEIGMVIFNHNLEDGIMNLFNEYTCAVDLSNSIKHGGTVSAETIKWWMHPDRTEARDNLSLGNNRTLPRALNDISSLLGEYSAIHPLPLIWGNGVNFDNAILKSAYKRLGVRVPWSYRQDVDFRTLKLLYKAKVPEPVFVGTPHIALDDARHEAFFLSNILKYMYRETKEVGAIPLDLTKFPLELPSKD